MLWRIIEAGAKLANSLAEHAGSQTEMARQKFIGMLGLYSIGSEGFGGKILEVLGHDHIAPARDRCREDMPISFVGRLIPWINGS